MTRLFLLLAVDGTALVAVAGAAWVFLKITGCI